MSGLIMLLVALDEIRRHRLRTAIATLSISAGVAAVTIIVALGTVAEATAESIIERQVGRPATMSISTEETAVEFAERVAPLVGSRLERYGVAEWSREYSWQVKVTLDGVDRPESVLGVDPALLQVRPLRVVAGRWLIESDRALFLPTVVVNTALVAEFGGEGLVGRRLRLESASGTVSARVVGVVDDANKESRLYAPVEPLVARLGTEGLRFAGAVVHLQPAAAARIAGRLVADARAGGLPRLDVRRVDAIDDFRELFEGLELVLGLIAGVSLVTGALGVVNLGLVTARQRAREFAIRRSFGATSANVFTIVLAEIVATSFLGGVLGVAIGAAVVGLGTPLFAASVGLTEVPPFPLAAALIGIGVALLVGVLAGLAPARRATRDSIIETIRT